MARRGKTDAKLIPDDEQLPITPEVLRSEVNLLTFPFFALSRKGLRRRIETEYRAVVERGEQKMEILWQVSSNAKYGYPGPFDQKVHRAIEEIINELPLPVQNPIGFSIYELCKRMQLEDAGGAAYRKIKEGLERIVATTVKSSGTFYAKGRKKFIDDVFHLYDRIVFRGERLPDGTMAEQNYLFLNNWYLENLNARYVRPLDYTYYKQLDSNIAQRLYEILGVKFYGLLHGGFTSIGYRYSTLCQLLPLTRQRYISRARQILDPAHAELVRTEFLAEVQWAEVEKEHEDWLITYIPGERARAELERFGPSSFDTALTENEQPQLPLGVDREREAEIQALVSMILEVTGDAESKAFYQRVARLCPADLIYRTLSEVKDAARLKQIRTSKGAVFTDKIKRYCRGRGIELGLKASG